MSQSPQVIRVPGARVRPPLWRDVRVLRVATQVAFLVVVVGTLYLLYRNARVNLANTGLPTGFDFLGRPAGFRITDSSFPPAGTVWRATLVGVGNTLRVSVTGILLATVFGVLIGIARLSTNWLVRKSAALYVEVLRNTPVLIIIIFFFVAVVAPVFPPIREAITAEGFVILSNRGVWIPWLTTRGAGLGGYWLVALATVVVTALVVRWRTRVSEQTGAPHHRLAWGAVTAVALLVVGYVATGFPFTVTGPHLDGLSAEGGIKLGASYFALLAALTLYTASHIAEIVRGSILAVPKGQTEAANALALTGAQRMRHVILPQALRIAVPPIGNQYLNLTKNSSLALAIGYGELTVVVQTSIGNGMPALQMILILMGWYLLMSLTLSVFTNIFNRRLAIVER